MSIIPVSYTHLDVYKRQQLNDSALYSVSVIILIVKYELLLVIITLFNLQYLKRIILIHFQTTTLQIR